MPSYLGGVLALSASTPSWVVSTPALNLGTPFILHRTRFTRLHFGPFGAAVFFGIIGLVILFSMEMNAWCKFLISRAFRIFLTFGVASAFEIIAVFARSKFDGRPMAFGPRIHIRNAMLPVVTVNSFYAFVIFVLAFRARGFFRPLRALITFIIAQRGVSHDEALLIAVGLIIFSACCAATVTVAL